MYNVNVVTINDKEYFIIKQINHNNNSYCYLSNPNDHYDICVKKIISKNGEYYLQGLEDENEFNLAMSLFNQ